MARPRSDNRDKAFEIYEQHDGKITNRAIAEQLGINEKTIGGWKCKDKWDDELNGVLRTKIRSTPNKKNKRGAPIGNKNAKGNKGGEGGPVGNDHAVTHGFFKRIFPQDEETQELLKDIQEMDPLEMIWNNIQIQMFAIANSQQIMWVTGKDEMIKELKRSYEKNTTRSTEKTRSNTDECEYEYEFQFAWDRQATYLKAQSRAMGELRSLIKQYEEMIRRGWGDEEQQLRIEKLKADIGKIRSTSEDENLVIEVKVTSNASENTD